MDYQRLQRQFQYLQTHNPNQQKNLIITGSIGSGKSTLATALSAGIYLPIITKLKNNPPPRQIVFYDPFTQIGYPMASFQGRMIPDQSIIESKCAAVVAAAIRQKQPLLIDEIGYVELDCPKYCAQLEAAFQLPQLIAVIRKMDHPFLRQLIDRSDTFVIDVDQIR